jgi:hypothetical protein
VGRIETEENERQPLMQRRHRERSVTDLVGTEQNIGVAEAPLMFLQDEYSSAVALGILLFRTADVLVLMACAVGSVWFFTYYRDHTGKALHANLSWVVVSFAIIFPLMTSVSAAFTRREAANQTLSNFRADLVSFFTAHLDWDWNVAPASVGGFTSGRARVPSDHADNVQTNCFELLEAIKRILSVKRVFSSRHFFTESGKRELAVVKDEVQDLLREGRQAMRRMSFLNEDLKRAGLPVAEGLRLNVLLNQFHAALEQLYCIKFFRYPGHICAGTGLTPPTSAPGLGSSLATSAPGLGSPHCDIGTGSARGPWALLQDAVGDPSTHANLHLHVPVHHGPVLCAPRDPDEPRLRDRDVRSHYPGLARCVDS